MKVVMSYLVKLENGTRAWLAAGKEPTGEILEERPMLIPDEGKVLRHKETGEISYGHWMRGEDTADKWEEIEEQGVQNEIHN